jgi:hypothetical protein
MACIVNSGWALEGDTRRMQRGTQCLAKDGHVCFSLVEKTIDDMLTELGISHEKEVKYPNSDFRCGLARGVYIEYFGLTGDPGYDAKTQQKLTYGRGLGMPLLALYSSDVAESHKLRETLLFACTGQHLQTEENLRF